MQLGLSMFAGFVSFLYWDCSCDFTTIMGQRSVTVQEHNHVDVISARKDEPCFPCIFVLLSTISRLKQSCFGTNVGSLTLS